MDRVLINHLRQNQSGFKRTRLSGSRVLKVITGQLRAGRRGVQSFAQNIIKIGEAAKVGEAAIVAHIGSRALQPREMAHVVDGKDAHESIVAYLYAGDAAVGSANPDGLEFELCRARSSSGA